MTNSGRFYLLDGKKVEVPMMYQLEDHGFMRGDGFTAAELLYESADMSMVIILPEEGEFDDVDKRLNPEVYGKIIEAITFAEMELVMPKFEFDSYYELKQALSALGMPLVFGSTADFSGIVEDGGIWIDEVFHKAYVKVDEKGTIAAATVSDTLTYGSIDGGPVRFIVDRPFIFIIRDIPTGTILFIGRVLNPLEGKTNINDTSI